MHRSHELFRLRSSQIPWLPVHVSRETLQIFIHSSLRISTSAPFPVHVLSPTIFLIYPLLPPSPWAFLQAWRARKGTYVHTWEFPWSEFILRENSDRGVHHRTCPGFPLVQGVLIVVYCPGLPPPWMQTPPTCHVCAKVTGAESFKSRSQSSKQNL